MKKTWVERVWTWWSCIGLAYLLSGLGGTQAHGHPAPIGHEVLMVAPSGANYGQTWQASHRDSFTQFCALRGFRDCYYTNYGGWALPDQSGDTHPFGISGWSKTNGQLYSMGCCYDWSYRAATPPAVPNQPAPVCPRPAGELAGHPISIATGEKVLDQTDITSAGPDPLDLVRHYRSHRVLGKIAAGKAGLGIGWSHNHAPVLRFFRTPGTSGSAVHVTLGDGTVRPFTWDAATASWRSGNSADSLAPDATGATYTDRSNDSTYRFDLAGRVLTLTRRNGWVLTYTYDGSGRLAAVANQFGRRLTFAYDASGRLISATSPDQKVVAFGFDAAGRLISATHAAGTSAAATRGYVYENASFPQLLTGVVDEMGNRYATYTYDAQGKGIATELAGGTERWQIAYPTSTTAAVTDPLGTQRTYSYSTSFGTYTVAGSDKPAGTGEPDAAARVANLSGLIAQETDYLGVTTLFTWDETRRLPLSRTEASGRPETRTTSTQWHPQLKLPVLVTEPGRTTSFDYDAAGNLLAKTVTDPALNESRTWQWTYNSQGLPATYTDPRGSTWTYSYDSSGNRTGETDPLDRTTTFGYDEHGRLTQETAPNGAVTTLTYDAAGRVESVSTAGLTTSFTYRPTGQLQTASFPSGLAIAYSYDAAQRLVGWSDNRGVRAEFALDAAGNAISERLLDQGGVIAFQVSRTINALNRVASETVGASETESYGFNANGDRTSASNGLSQTTVFGLDSLRRMTAVADPSGATASIAYNGTDGVTSISDFKGVTTNYARNAFGDAGSETSPDIGSRSTGHDALGLPTSVTDALGQTTSIQRDALARPTMLGFADGRQTLLRHDLPGPEYNASDAPNASKRHLSEAQDRSGTTRWQRDLHGRVTQKVQMLANGSTQVVGYSYNTQGLLDTLTYPGGGQLKHHYTAAGQLTTMSWNGVPLVTGITWNAAGRPTGWTWAFSTPVQANRSYDTAGRMTANEVAAYTWDAAGRLTGIVQVLARPGDADPLSSSIAWGTVTFTAGYDSVGRITSFGNGSASTSFSYDANGNRLSSGWSEAGSSETRTYAVESGSNRLASVTQAATGPGGSASATIGYVYDANGALTFDGRNRYAYDAEGRLSSSAPATGEEAPVTRYAHNALGQRVFKTEPQYAQPQQSSEQSLWEQFLAFFGLRWAPQTQPNEQLGWAFVYDEEGTLLSEMGMGGPNSTGSTHHIWLPTPSGPMPIAVIVNGGKFAVHADHLNTPRRLTSESGEAVWQWGYSAFGDEEPTRAAQRFAHPSEGLSTPMPGVTYNLRYPGQYGDRESGLHYNYFRSYDAFRGGYLQADPSGLDGGWNPFAYVDSDPLKKIDPYGLVGESPVVQIDIGPDLVEPTRRSTSSSLSIPRVYCPPGGGGRSTKLGNAKKQRNAPPDRLPQAEGRPHSIIEIPGPNGQYTTYKSDGSWMQYRGSGKDHGGIPRPNVKEQTTNTTPDGRTFHGDRVRPAIPSEIPR